MNVTLSKNQALSIATLLVATDQTRNAAAPVLTEIRVIIADGKLTAYATDRFMAVKYQDTVDAADVEFRLTRNLAKFISTNVKAKYYGDVEIIIDDENGDVTVSLDYGQQKLTERPVSAKFPAVETLIDTWTADNTFRSLALKIEFLARLEKIKLDGEFADLWHFEPGLNTNNSNRPGPVMATAAKDPERLVALVQPNLLVKRD